MQRSAFVWVYEPDGVTESVAWRLGVYDGRCLGALCWDVDACHVRPGCVLLGFVEMCPETAPWVRSVVGAPKGRPKAKGKAKAKSVATGQTTQRGSSGRFVASETSGAASSSGVVDVRLSKQSSYAKPSEMELGLQRDSLKAEFGIISSDDDSTSLANDRFEELLWQLVGEVDVGSPGLEAGACDDAG